MYSMTRNVLLLLLLLMTGGMFYGFFQGSTPDIKALLALLYGLSVGMAVCVVLLIVLPAIELARKTSRTEPESQRHA